MTSAGLKPVAGGGLPLDDRGIELFAISRLKGIITLLINQKDCGSMEVPATLRGSSTGMSIGRDNPSLVTDDYQAPFPFQE